MNLDDLAWQRQFDGGIEPAMAEYLARQGQLELLIETARDRGEWFCAEVAVGELCEAGEFERALTVLEPFVAVGWPFAVRESATILVRQGRIEEGLALVRPDAAGLESAFDCRWFAGALVEAGRVDEAIEVLAPHLGEPWILESLVDLTRGENRDALVLELLAPCAERALGGAADCRCSAAGGRRECRHQPSEVLVKYSRVLERMGRADEAIRRLGPVLPAVPGVAWRYAELLADQGRFEQLRELATGEHAGLALNQYAKALEEQGELREAEAVLHEALATDAEYTRRRLMAFLARQGRLDEVVDVGRPTYEDAEGSLLHEAIDLLIRAGSPERALELVDSLGAAYVEAHADVLGYTRLRLLAKAGRYAEGIAGARALNEREPGQWDTTLAWLLDLDGRPDEALDLLRSSTEREAHRAIAQILTRHGHYAEAVAVIPTVPAQREAWDRR
ncbi:tetratricopeptide repeat protein [Kitasatospora sp. MY 5-36]|uniref:tetratricopeptide repeat protein n=1 Tax=Kitasatospora sp. MY 5-36 TaxID=1678027 RepID=UPI000A76264C|nr:tetratricopeptide repeat protein [Kitasatospora sp. MY 5-36]